MVTKPNDQAEEKLAELQYREAFHICLTQNKPPNEEEITRDGCRDEIADGTTLRLEPGLSISLPVRQYHRFWGEPGHGTVLVGEVSMVNDDNADNRFYEPARRFHEITEDEAPLLLLCNEHPQARA